MANPYREGVEPSGFHCAVSLPFLAKFPRSQALPGATILRLAGGLRLRGERDQHMNAARLEI